MEFSIGERVVYPLKGIGEVVDIVEDKVLDEFIKMFKIQLKDMIAFIPINEVKELGIRRPLTQEELDEILLYIEKPDTGFTQDWIKRFDENKIKSSKGDAYDLVDVIKIITIIAYKNSINKYERDLLTESKKYFTDELAYILNCTKEEAKYKLERALRKMVKNLETCRSLLSNARKLYRKEKYFQAISELIKITEIDKNNIESNVLLADSYLKIDNIEKAEEYFEYSRKIDENNYLFNLKYGYHLFDKGKKDEALEYFKKSSVNIEVQREKKELFEFLKENYEE